MHTGPLARKNPTSIVTRFSKQSALPLVVERSKATIQPYRSRFAAGSLLTAILLTVVLGIFTDSVTARQNLPNMGEPADNLLSPSAERQLGEQFMRQIRASVPLIRDSQIAEYIQALGLELVATTDNGQRQPFNFFVIDNPNINAFAIPGGFVGLNAGLIAVMDTEDQLAGVLAHEIAHVTQRHHARASASGTRTKLTTALAVLAAIVIGQSNPQAGHAALAAGLAASQQSIINFTRLNEYEADRIGIEVLADANFTPAAMAQAFEILRRKNSLNTSGAQIEYLRTHPLDNNRIAEAKNRAADLPEKQPDSLNVEFDIFKARLHILSTQDDARIRREYEAMLQAAEKDKTGSHASTRAKAGAEYALAMLDLRGRQNAEATRRLDRLTQNHPGNLDIQLLLAEARHASGDENRAQQLLDQLISLFPDSYAIVELKGNQLVAQRKMQKAHGVVTEYIRSASNPNPRAWRQLANIHQKLGDEAASHEALSRFFLGLNELQRAKEQLDLALKTVGIGSQDELRLRAQQQLLTKKIEALR